MGTEEQHVECRSHTFVLFWEAREQASQVAAQLRPTGATSLSQESEQLPQARKPGSVDDLSALAGRLGQPGTLQGSQVK